MNVTIRLNKFISDSGFCSRREADKHIELGNVFVNGVRSKVGDIIKTSDKVMVNGHKITAAAPDDLIIIALNKPVGITCTTESGTEGNIIEFVNHSHRIFPIGRLDKDSQGIIFLTNNGDLVNKILRAGNRHEKEYVVTVDKVITDDFIEGMAGGVPLLGTKTKKCKVQKETPFIFRITLIQGLNRQIRRMCSHFGYEVIKLERVRIMNITLKGLPLGDWRDFTEEEVEDLMRMLERSSSTTRKERSFSKNMEFRKTSPIESRGRDERLKYKSGRFTNKKSDIETDEAPVKSKKVAVGAGRKQAPKSIKGNSAVRENASHRKWKAETKTNSTPTKRSRKASKPAKDKSATKASANPKSFKRYRQKGSKR